MESLSWEQVLALMTLSAAGVGAIWATFSKVILPAWHRYQDNKLEHQQEMEDRQQLSELALVEMQAKTDELERLAMLQNRAYQDEQLTLFSSEAMTQLGVANEYLRTENSQKLDIAIIKLDQVINLLGRVATALERQTEPKD
jgi:hypothetical protein